MAGSSPRWRPMRADDLPGVVALGNVVHTNFVERPEVFTEKFELFPNGCLTFVKGGGVAGYALSHPWRGGAPPKLDAPLGALPAQADALFLHDLCLAPRARGGGAGTAALTRLVAVARLARLPAIELVAVSGSAPFWAKLGFRPVAAGERLSACYGGEARLMRRELSRPA